MKQQIFLDFATQQHLGDFRFLKEAQKIMSLGIIQKLQVNVFKMTSTVSRHFPCSVLQALVPSSKKASAEVQHVIGSQKVHISLYISCVAGNGLSTLVELCKLEFRLKDSPPQVVSHKLSEGDISSHEFSSENTFHSIQVKTIAFKHIQWIFLPEICKHLWRKGIKIKPCTLLHHYN